MIRRVKIEDAKDIVEIYNFYIQNSLVTFEEHVIDETEMKSRIQRISIVEGYPFWVYTEDNKVLGYAYGDKWRTRSAYRYTLESTVYVHKDHYQKSIGTLLYKRLIDDIKDSEFTEIVGGITLPNEESVRLHEKFGFVKVAHFRNVGFKFDQWADVGFWQLSIGNKD